MIRHALLLAVTIALGACGAGQNDQPDVAGNSEATTAPSEPRTPMTGSERPASETPHAQVFDAVGTEPFWAVQVREDSLRLSRPDYAEVIVEAPRPTAQVNTLVWKAKAMTVSITPGACSDGMSDRRYRYVAEVRVGAEILEGCAYQPGAAPSAGPGS